MSTIIVISKPPQSQNLAQKLGQNEVHEFERPDGEPLADSLRAIADEIESEE